MSKPHVLSRKEVFGDPPRYITVKGLSKILGVSETTVRRYIKKGKIPSKQVTCIPWAVVSSMDIKYMKDYLSLKNEP